MRFCAEKLMISCSLSGLDEPAPPSMIQRIERRGYHTRSRQALPYMHHTPVQNPRLRPPGVGRGTR